MIINLLTQLNSNLKANSIKLPHTFFEQIINANYEPPFFFKIKTEIGTSIITSVNEFTSDLSTIQLSEDSLDNLCISDNYIVEVEFIEKVPKGKMIRITPLSEDFFKIPEYDSILETKISDYSILYNNQIISLDIFDKKYQIMIDNIEPNWDNMEIKHVEMINIINIDLSVDINNKFLEKDILDKKILKEQKEKINTEQKEKEKINTEQRQKKELELLKNKFLKRFE